MKNWITLKNMLWTAVWIVAMNALFYGLHFLSVLMPVRTIQTRTAEAFKARNLVPENYPKLKYGLASNYALIGLDQFTDGLVIQMSLYRHPSALRAAFLPKIAMPEGSANPAESGTARGNVQGIMGRGIQNDFPCETVRRLVVDGARVGESESYYYHRYWWGQKVVLSLLLPFFDYFQINNLLKVLTYFAFLAIACWIALFEPRRFWIFFPVLSMGMLFSGTIYYGGLTDSTSFLTSLVLLLALLFFQHRSRAPERLAPFFVVLGSLAAFIYSMRGGLMLFCSVAFLVLFFITFERKKHVDRFIGSFACLAFFFAGFLASFAVKQAVSALWLDWKTVFGDFLFQLKYRIGTGGRDYDPSLVRLFGRVFFNYVYATYNSRALADILTGGGMLAWCVSAGLAVAVTFRRKSHSVPVEWLAVCAAAAIVFARIALFKNHSYVHAWFIGRYMFLPLAFGWTAMILMLRKWRI
jgi:hypothetical protein